MSTIRERQVATVGIPGSPVPLYSRTTLELARTSATAVRDMRVSLQDSTRILNTFSDKIGSLEAACASVRTFFSLQPRERPVADPALRTRERAERLAIDRIGEIYLTMTDLCAELAEARAESSALRRIVEQIEAGAEHYDEDRDVAIVNGKTASEGVISFLDSLPKAS